MTHRSRAQVGMAGWPQLTFAEPATATIDSAVVDLSVCVGPQRRLSTGSPRQVSIYLPGPLGPRS